ncbi:MAG: hypothetical protein JNK72_14925 [Myxococcales bacterium]|nr:hypothetical protein [Myxococcales bacterium]
MEIQTQLPLHDKQGLAQHLQRMFPQYKVEPNMHGVIVGNGLATGVLVRDMGNGRAKLIWEFPSLATKFFVILTIVFGILPGLILFGLVWAVTNGDVDRMRNEVSHALVNGAPAAMGAPGMPGMAGMPGVAMAPTGPRRGMAVTFGLLTLLSGAFTAYNYSEYQSAYVSPYSSYGSYGRYGSYGSSYSYIRRARFRERYEGGMVVTGICFVLTLVGLARMKGGSAPQPAPYGQPMPGQPYPQQGFGGQPMPGQPYPPQGFGGQPMPGQPFGTGPQGQPMPGQPYPPQGFGTGPQGQPYPQQGFGTGPQGPQAGPQGPQTGQEGWGPGQQPGGPQGGGWGPPPQG